MGLQNKVVERLIPLASALIVVVIGIFSSGCLGGEADTPTTPTGVTVTTVSGNLMDISGVWKGCIPTLFQNSSSLTLTLDKFTSIFEIQTHVGSGCTGTVVGYSKDTDTIVDTSYVATLAGWTTIDLYGNPLTDGYANLILSPAPEAALAGGGALTASDITVLELTLASTTDLYSTLGEKTITGLVVDDTNSAVQAKFYMTDIATPYALGTPVHGLSNMVFIKQ